MTTSSNTPALINSGKQVSKNNNKTNRIKSRKVSKTGRIHGKHSRKSAMKSQLPFHSEITLLDVPLDINFQSVIDALYDIDLPTFTLSQSWEVKISHFSLIINEKKRGSNTGNPKIDSNFIVSVFPQKKITDALFNLSMFNFCMCRTVSI